MRKRLSYANVAATLALVFSMTGGAVAANNYLISSTKEIKPSVLKKLKGKTGKTGKTGAAGAAGKEGAPGKEGAAGKEGPAGSAVAFAHITGASEPKAPLDAANSKNVTAASEGQKGLYCITTAVPVKNVTASADFISAGVIGFNFSEVPLAVALKLCPASTTVLAETSNTKGETQAADFWVSFN